MDPFTYTTEARITTDISETHDSNMNFEVDLIPEETEAEEAELSLYHSAVALARASLAGIPLVSRQEESCRLNFVPSPIQPPAKNLTDSSIIDD